MRLPINELGYAMSFVKQAQVNSQPLPRGHTITKAVATDGNTPWQLARGCALSLRPRGAGVLRVTSGRAWVTLDVSHGSPVADAGDHFVEPGHDLELRAGQRLVLESWPASGADCISLVWEPRVPAAGRALARLWVGWGRLAELLTAGHAAQIATRSGLPLPRLQSCFHRGCPPSGGLRDTP